MTIVRAPLRIGNLSTGRSARSTVIAELLDAARLDVLAVDMLSDEAVVALHREREADGGAGYEASLVPLLDAALDRIGSGRTRIVTNAGGFDPAGLADAVVELAGRRGVRLSVAYVVGSIDEAHRDEAEWRPGVASSIRLGIFGIARALAEGADVVITGRVSRESFIAGAAAAHHGWGPGDLDRLAGGVAAGHVVSGGPGVTGLVESSTDLTRPADPIAGGFPIAEIDADGDCVITRHPGALGAVTVGTVTDQLLDGVMGARYWMPDVVLRLDSLRLLAEGADRVRMRSARGEAPPPDVAIITVRADADGRRTRWVRHVPQHAVEQRVVFDDGRTFLIPPPAETAVPGDGHAADGLPAPVVPGGTPTTAPLGTVAGVRSGILYSAVNIGAWTWDDSAFAWLREIFSVDLLLRLLPEFEGAEVERFELPNLRAVNFVVRDVLDRPWRPPSAEPGDGSLGERLRRMPVTVPADLLEIDP